ncbi:hypothetical protein [Saccharomonospora halophila]|uniref:hypothetical protein n=1 Tax=Saccharomonospora halophila TaxID=129922 RepID=UPI0005847D59|nr:hypothetical protein [Saccharomonospora halophila]
MSRGKVTAPARRVLYAALGTWFGLTVVGQKLYRDQRRQTVWDRLYLLIPDWRFFAPNPGIHDHHLLLRDRLTDDSLTEFREVSRVRERTLLQALWHPHRRAEKTIFDSVAELLRYVGQHGEGRRGPDPSLQLSVPYLTLLAYVTAREHHPDAVRTQFLIAISGGYETEDEPTMVFLSEWHALDTPAAGERR